MLDKICAVQLEPPSRHVIEWLRAVASIFPLLMHRKVGKRGCPHTLTARSRARAQARPHDPPTYPAPPCRAAQPGAPSSIAGPWLFLLSSLLLPSEDEETAVFALEAVQGYMLVGAASPSSAVIVALFKLKVCPRPAQLLLKYELAAVLEPALGIVSEMFTGEAG